MPKREDTEVAVLKQAMRDILAIAPACSAEAERIDRFKTCGRTCQWRDELRRVQRRAATAMMAVGGEV